MPMHSNNVSLAFDFGLDPLAAIPDSDILNFDTLFSEPEEGNNTTTHILTGFGTSATDPSIELLSTTPFSTPELILPDFTPTPTPPPNHLEDTLDESLDSGRPTKRARLTRSSYCYITGGPNISSLSSSLSEPLHENRSSQPRPPTTRSRRATSSPPPEPITMNGHILQPTVVWDTFWRWCAERKTIYDRRQAGEPFPCVLVWYSCLASIRVAHIFPFL